MSTMKLWIVIVSNLLLSFSRSKTTHGITFYLGEGWGVSCLTQIITASSINNFDSRCNDVGHKSRWGDEQWDTCVSVKG